MVFLDTETVGLCGPAVIIQYAFDDGPIQVHHFWKETMGDSLKILESILENECVVGFNLAFDWFQICKIYTMFNLYCEKYGTLNDFPEDHIERLAMLETDARDGPCLKPRAAVDLMLVARKTTYQSTMNRSDIKIRKVPSVLAHRLAKHLEKTVIFSNVLFARRKDKLAPKWKVETCFKKIGSKTVVDPDFCDVVLRFKPSVALKALAADALGVDVESILKFTDVEVDKSYRPNELPYAPFALAVKNYVLNSKTASTKEGHKIYVKRQHPWRWAWPDVIHKHIDHWYYDTKALRYASDDVVYTRDLYKFFGCPEFDDNDSKLACMVGAVRWKGFTIDLDGIKKLEEEATVKLKGAPMAPSAVKKYLTAVLSAEENIVLQAGTGKLVLQGLAERVNTPCPTCEVVGLDSSCETCKGKGLYTHPVAERAQKVLNARFAKKEIELYQKLQLSGRFHASFKVIGTLSSRMSGSDGLNPQGIKRDKSVRVNFTFSDKKTRLQGGDFDGFEVVIAEAVYKDPELRAALEKKATCPGCLGKGKKKGKVCDDCDGEGKTGQKIHGLFAMELAPGLTYEDVIKSKGTAQDWYDLGKRGVFSQIYGGDEGTLVRKLNITLERATRAAIGFKKRFPGMARERQKVVDAFCSMRQPGGIGSRVEWHEPQEYIESLFGFRRYFTLENMVCKALFQLANKPPEEWKSVAAKIKVVRRDRQQTASGALASALYGAAFQIQAANTRAAANHVIQSSGAQITKTVQCRIWDLQPPGVNKWHVQTCNVHDEILAVVSPEMESEVTAMVNETVESFRSTVPLIKMEWKPMNTWADK